MNIGVLLDPFNEKQPGGLGRSTFELAKAILTEDAHNAYAVYVKQIPAKPLSLPGDPLIKVLGNVPIWLAGGFSMDRSLDAYIFFTPVIPLFFRPKKSIVVALDFAYLNLEAHTFKDWLQSRLLYYVHKRSLHLATKIVAISTQTKNSVVEHFGIDPAKIEVVLIGYIEPSKKLECIAVPEHFFLFAGVLKERKNVAGIITAFANMPAQYSLVIAGKDVGSYATSLHALTQTLGIAERVQFLGYVTNEQLAYLYSRAEALVFPSFIEGFGMPVLEAMSVGLPVITSKEGALAEVAGGAALLVDPNKPHEITAAMNQIVQSPSVKEELHLKGLERVKEFSWQKAAQAFVEHIGEL